MKKETEVKAFEVKQGTLINYVKECLPTADGKTVANIVKKFID